MRELPQKFDHRNDADKSESEKDIFISGKSLYEMTTIGSIFRDI